MLAMTFIRRVSAPAAFVCLVSLVGCDKKPAASNPEGNPTPAPAGPTSGKTPTQGNTPTPKETPKPLPDLTDAKPEGAYTVEDYSREQTADFSFPGKKHAGKVIDVSGIVSSWTMAPKGLVVYLANGKEFRPFRITGKTPWLSALPKQTITIRTMIAKEQAGLFTDYEWQVVAVKGPPPTTYTAEELFKAWKTDADGFGKKYGEEEIIIIGTITSVERPAPRLDVYLHAGPDESVRCEVPEPPDASIPLTEAQRAALKPGQKVKLLGKCRAGSLGVYALSCVLLEPTP